MALQETEQLSCTVCKLCGKLTRFKIENPVGQDSQAGKCRCRERAQAERDARLGLPCVTRGRLLGAGRKQKDRQDQVTSALLSPPGDLVLPLLV